MIVRNPCRLARVYLIVVTGLLVLNSPDVAFGQEEHLEDHFLSDDDRRAIMDDRGGQGVGYSFSIGYDPDDYNSENFCSHCSLAVFVSDPGIDLDELEVLGVGREEVETLDGLLATLDSLSEQDPSALASELQPDLEGAELEAFIDEVTRIVGRATELARQLESLTSVFDLNLDWETTDLDDLRLTLGLAMDSAYRADFDSPNDVRRHTSGVDVYSLEELLLGMATDGFPDEAQDTVETVFSSIPSLPGTFEISGDDDSVLSPVSFHGRYTDLTIEARSYVVNTQNAFLLVYTVVNDTQRVMPLVEVAMIADFDIPPASYDTETVFDPVTTTVMVYDTVPYEDPEIHSWFGLSPASPVSATDFVFANYNLDNMMSLSQSARSINENRFRFFLGHPDVSGDHDDADGKSEKQGAISLVLPGPMLPGDRRNFAFCYAGAESTSNAAALAEMTATLEACKALYFLVNTECGDAIPIPPEVCDDGNTSGGDGCSADCLSNEVCGNSIIDADAGEVCDDSNTTGGDGCSADCRSDETCRNGVVDEITSDGSEECDDGNGSNTDMCLNTCVDARCGDGYLLDCTEAEEGCPSGCDDHEVCMVGSFTLDDYPDIFGTKTGIFDELIGVPIDFRFAFDVDSVEYDGTYVRVRTRPVSVEMEGHPLASDTIAAALDGQAWGFQFEGDGASSNGYITAEPLQGVDTSGEHRFVFSFISNNVTWNFSYPEPPDFAFMELGTTMATLKRSHVAPPSVTDEATGWLAAGFGTAGEEIGEECDDGNLSDFDSCTSTCVPAACGDGFIQLDEDEECDEGLSPPAWCVDCLRVAIALCGNTVTDEGEECDDGNTSDDDGCNALCLNEYCGDGNVQASEECDDGQNGDGDGCSNACLTEFCGDGVTQPTEECDTGELLADDSECLTSCVLSMCGDGFVLEGEEECDDGNLEDADGCSSGCVEELCGDGLPGPEEECDDGNVLDGDGCSQMCIGEYCGDALPGPEEECDDGNTVDGDGCDKDCLLENDEACGDGVVGLGEQCDDGGRLNGDGCDEFCQLEAPDACGDGVIDLGESCDDSNNVGGDGCSPFCTAEVCGDGIHHDGEACDDGNDVDGDGCSVDCLVEPATCGNGVHEYGEQCDDGNADDNDGCTVECAVDPLDSAPLRETCGNGVLDYGEECDDGGRREGDGCGELCQLEARVCGNARLDHGETCDEGDDEPGDGCSAICLIEVCGNGAVDVDETCDDGNTVDDDGCSALCIEEYCGDSVVQAGELCDEGEANGGDLCPEDCGVSDIVEDDGCSCNAPAPPGSEPASAEGCSVAGRSTPPAASRSFWSGFLTILLDY